MPSNSPSLSSGMNAGEILASPITFFGRRVTLACDGRCDKAFGINNRPRMELGGDPDDYVFLADSEVGVAPNDPGTYEGGDAKPLSPNQHHNRWCARECERSQIVNPGETIRPPDFSQRLANIAAPDHTEDVR